MARVRTSSTVLIGAVCQTMQTLVSLLALPIQAIVSTSKWPSTPISGSNGMPRWMVAIAVPSLGATLVMKLIRRRPLAPGMFCTTVVGLPGRCLPRWRANRRA